MMRLPILLLLAACATVAPAQVGNRPSGDIQRICNAAAPKLRESGKSKFVLMMTVDNSGRVESFKTESPKGLRLEKVQDAADAIKEMQFKPAQKGWTPVAVQVKITFDCADKLSDAPKH
jgi:TonB family protein